MANVIEPKPVKITETILRDAHQSLVATRMTTEDILPIVEKLDKVGYHSLEGTYSRTQALYQCVSSTKELRSGTQAQRMLIYQ